MGQKAPIQESPIQTLLQGRPWIPSAQTNVQETWRKFGWSPTHPQPAPGSEVPYQLKGK